MEKSPTEIFKRSLKIIPLYKQYFVGVQSLRHVQFFANPWPVACEASLSFTISWSLLKSLSPEVVMPSNHLLLSPSSPPTFNLSQHQGLFLYVV